GGVASLRAYIAGFFQRAGGGCLRFADPVTRGVAGEAAIGVANVDKVWVVEETFAFDLGVLVAKPTEDTEPIVHQVGLGLEVIGGNGFLRKFGTAQAGVVRGDNLSVRLGEQRRFGGESLVTARGRKRGNFSEVQSLMFLVDL